MKKALLSVSFLIGASTAFAEMAGAFENRANSVDAQIGTGIYNTNNTQYNLLNSAWGAMHIYDNQTYQNAWGSNRDVNFSAWFKSRSASWTEGNFPEPKRKYFGTYTSQCAGSLLVGITDQDLICRSKLAVKSQNAYILIAKPGENTWYLLNGQKNEAASSLVFLNNNGGGDKTNSPSQSLSRWNLTESRTVDSDKIYYRNYATAQSYPVLFRTLPYDASNPDFVEKGDVSSWKIRANRGLTFVVPQGTGCLNPGIFEPLFSSDVNGDLVNTNMRLLAMTWDASFNQNALRSNPNPKVAFDRLFNYVVFANWIDHGEGNIPFTAADEQTFGPAYNGRSENYNVEYLSNPNGVAFGSSRWPWFDHTNVQLSDGTNVSLSNASELTVRIINSRFSGEAAGLNGKILNLTLAALSESEQNALVTEMTTRIGPIQDMLSFTDGDDVLTWYRKAGDLYWNDNCYSRKYQKIAYQRIDAYKVSGFGVGRITHPDNGNKNANFCACAIASELLDNGDYSYPFETQHRYAFNNLNGWAIEAAPNYRPSDGNFNSQRAPLNPASRPMSDCARYAQAKIGQWIPIPNVGGSNPAEVDLYSYGYTNRASYVWGEGGASALYRFHYTNKGGSQTEGTTAKNIVFGRFAGIDSSYWRAVNRVNSDSHWPGLQKYVYRVPSQDVGGSIADASPEGEIFPKGSVVIAIPKIIGSNVARKESSWIATALFVTTIVTGVDFGTVVSTPIFNNNWDQFDAAVRNTSGGWGDFGGDGIHYQVFMDYALNAASAFEPYAQEAQRNGR